ncbi:hypothetical protein CANARDRAFT_21866 [[Candida] arabinofermentans NRRL YB-2248]|uniref:Uncharacterized protein n=1 Tax=[Candida] arabinofermentans NRRL YB-2248 TaxID=983967 RepID=A0A1E4T543_9ASCO|nr:hypothetical protein CANARDRAFT_21866 [[Candida] arabinofermentans NRRL YB-2248]
MYPASIRTPMRQLRHYASSSEGSLATSLMEKLKNLKEVSETKNVTAKSDSGFSKKAGSDQRQNNNRNNNNRNNNNSYKNNNNNRNQRLGQGNNADQRIRSSFRGNNNKRNIRASGSRSRLGAEDQDHEVDGESTGDDLVDFLGAIDTDLKAKALHTRDTIRAQIGKNLSQESRDELDNEELKKAIFDANETSELANRLNVIPGEKSLAEQEEEYYRLISTPPSMRVKPKATRESARRGLRMIEGVNRLVSMGHKKEFDLNTKTLKRSPSELSYEYQLNPISATDLEFGKSKMGYDLKSRVMRAVDQITTKRGFPLGSLQWNGQKLVPANSKIYPYANPLLSTSLVRPLANLNHLSNVSPDEIKQTFDTTVRGLRAELPRSQEKNFKTEQSRVNAEAVANALNSNAQLKVDNLHMKMAPVFLEHGSLKQLPTAVNPPKKI